MLNKRYTNVFWDWNGTIIDDLGINYDVINTLLYERKIKPISLSKYRSVFSFPIKNFYLKVGLPVDDDRYEELVHDYWNLYNSKINNIPLMNGVLDVISNMSNNNIKQYILSASDKSLILNQLCLYGIDNFFDDVISPQDKYAQGKIEIAKQWMSEKNISKTESIMIGDTFHDYETAKTIGIDCVLVDNGHQDLKPFKYDTELMIYDNIVEMMEHVFK